MTLPQSLKGRDRIQQQNTFGKVRHWYYAGKISRLSRRDLLHRKGGEKKGLYQIGAQAEDLCPTP